MPKTAAALVGVWRVRENVSGKFIRRYHLKDELDGAS